MIQFNLLPDVKMEFIKTRRRKRLVVLVSLCVAGASVGVLVMLVIVVMVWQKQSIKSLEKDITTNMSTLKSISEIDKVLTVQNQLNSLTSLHDDKPLASRMFAYISQITPASVSVQRVSLDFDTSTMSVTGRADALSTINIFVDTIKFTEYSSSTQTEPTRAFNDVVLANFSRDDKGASYEIRFLFDPAIYDATADNVSLVVPKLITTRSELAKPGVFEAVPGGTQ